MRTWLEGPDWLKGKLLFKGHEDNIPEDCMMEASKLAQGITLQISVNLEQNIIDLARFSSLTEGHGLCIQIFEINEMQTNIISNNS